MIYKKPAEEMKTILKDSPDSFFLHSLDGDLIYANETARETLGYNENELISSKFNELNVMIQNNLIKNYTDLIENGNTYFESSQIVSDGSIIDVESNILESADNSLILSVVRNSHELNSDDIKLNRFDELLRKSKKGMIIENIGLITYLNQNLCNLLGYSKNEMLGHEYIDFFKGIQEFSILDELIKVKMGGVSNLISKMRRKDGSNLWTLTTISPIYNEDGDYLGNLSTLRDISQLS